MADPSMLGTMPKGKQEGAGSLVNLRYFALHQIVKMNHSIALRKEQP